MGCNGATLGITWINRIYIYIKLYIYIKYMIYIYIYVEPDHNNELVPKKGACSASPRRLGGAADFFHPADWTSGLGCKCAISPVKHSPYILGFMGFMVHLCSIFWAHISKMLGSMAHRNSLFTYSKW